MLADEVDYVIGVDTHRDEHVLAVVAAPSGVVIAQRRALALCTGAFCNSRKRTAEGAGQSGRPLSRLRISRRV